MHWPFSHPYSYCFFTSQYKDFLTSPIFGEGTTISCVQFNCNASKVTQIQTSKSEKRPIEALWLYSSTPVYCSLL